MYISTGVWRDLTDGHLYHEGEPFPFDGREVGKERLDELTGSQNRAGFAVVRAVEVHTEPKQEKPENGPVKAQEKKVARKPKQAKK